MKQYSWRTGERSVARAAGRKAGVRLALGVLAAAVMSVATPGVQAQMNTHQLGAIKEYKGFPGACGLAIDNARGLVWTDELLAFRIGQLDLNTGEKKHFPVPTLGGVPGGLAYGPDGGVWFTQITTNKIGRLDPSTGVITEFNIPSPMSVPTGMALGPDGGLWFQETGIAKLGRIDPFTHEIVEYPLPGLVPPLPSVAMSAHTALIAQGANNSMIFSLGNANAIGEFDIGTKVFTRYQIPTPLSSPTGVTIGPDRAIWFTEQTGQKIGRVDPATHQITEYPISTLQTLLPFPQGIVAGVDGNLYTANGLLEGGSTVTRFNPRTRKVTGVFTTPTPASGPCEIYSGPNGLILFGEATAGAIGVLKIVP